MSVQTRNPAEIYDAHFVPALFAPWGPVVAAEAQVRAATGCWMWPAAPAR